MATLYDLAMQYLNQSLPKTFKYDRTNQPGIPTPVLPVQPTDPVKKILPVQGGGDGAYNPYNPDPNSITNKNYSPYAYRQAMAKSGVGIPSGILSDSEFLYGKKSPLEGVMSMLPGQQILKGLASKLPVNRRGIFENELAGQGIMVNDIGQIVSDGGNINTAENIMAGYNANKVTAETFQKRRDMINANMKDPAQKAAKLAALDAAEEKMLGTAKTRADMVFDMKSLAKDPTYKNFDQKVTEGLLAGDEGDDLSEIPQDKLADIYPQSFKADTFDDKVGSSNQFTYPIGPDGLEMDNVRTIVRNPNYSGNVNIPFGGTVLEDEEDDEEFDPTAPLNLNTTTAPPFMNFYNPYERDNIVDEFKKQQDAIKQQELIDQNAMDPGTVVDNSAPPNNNPNEDHDGDGVPNNVEAAGGSYDGGYSGPEGGFEFTGNFGDPYSDDNFMAGDNSKADPTGTGNFSDQVTGNDTSPGATGGEGGAGTGGSTKIVCTMMNESYGFGSFRNKIWMKFHKDLSPEYQKGYHKIFLPLVRIAKTNKVVKKILEHIAVHSTIDMRQATRGKMHLLGRIYRKILLPLCYIVGKHG